MLQSAISQIGSSVVLLENVNTPTAVSAPSKISPMAA
jgi:hypothetical protein